MKTAALLLAALSLTSAAFAHEEKKEPAKHTNVGEHAKGAEHADAPRSFAARPEVGTWAKCPVSGDVFKVAKDTQIAQHGGRYYAFCCAECGPDFEKNPSKFADKS